MLARRYLVVCFGVDAKNRASSDAFLIDCKAEEKIESKVREAQVYLPPPLGIPVVRPEVEASELKVAEPSNLPEAAGVEEADSSKT